MGKLNDAIHVTGHRGMISTAIGRRLQALGYQHIVTAIHAEFDPAGQAVEPAYLARESIDVVVLTEAQGDAMHTHNFYPADVVLADLLTDCSVIGAAHAAGMHCLMFQDSSCVYPRMPLQPKRVRALFADTKNINGPYAVAKIAGISCVRASTLSTGETTAVSCSPIGTARATLSTRKTVTSPRRCSRAFKRRCRRGQMRLILA